MQILLGVTLPGFSGLLDSITPKTTSRQLINNLEKIRSQAIIMGEEQHVVVKREAASLQTESRR